MAVAVSVLAIFSSLGIVVVAAAAVHFLRPAPVNCTWSSSRMDIAAKNRYCCCFWSHKRQIHLLRKEKRGGNSKFAKKNERAGEINIPPSKRKALFNNNKQTKIGCWHFVTVVVVVDLVGVCLNVCHHCFCSDCCCCCQMVIRSGKLWRRR